MSQHQAEQLAQQWLAQHDAGRRIPWRLAQAHTRAVADGWLVFYAIGGFIGGQLPGNAPLLVGNDGVVRVTGTALPTAAYV